jgi:hypothetical protein
MAHVEKHEEPRATTATDGAPVMADPGDVLDQAGTPADATITIQADELLPLMRSHGRLSSLRFEDPGSRWPEVLRFDDPGSRWSEPLRIQVGWAPASHILDSCSSTGPLSELVFEANARLMTFANAFLEVQQQVLEKLETEGSLGETTDIDTVRRILHELELPPRVVKDEDGVAFDFYGARQMPNGGRERYASLHFSTDGDVVLLLENRANPQQDLVRPVMKDGHSLREAVQAISTFLNG